MVCMDLEFCEHHLHLEQNRVAEFGACTELGLLSTFRSILFLDKFLIALLCHASLNT